MAIDYFRAKKKNGFDDINISPDFDKKLKITDTSTLKYNRTSFKRGIIITPELINLKGPVKIVWWEDPRCIYVVPAEPEFRRIHQSYRSFIIRLGSSQFKLEDEVAAKQKYGRGEFCFFRDYINRDLGPWLRGVVLKTPKISCWDCFSSNRKYCCSQEELSGIMEKENFVYQIQSIDYGFKVYKSPRNLRKVNDPYLFKSYVPWALRCSLYGLYPIASDIESNNPGGFSTTCIDMMERWIREKLLDVGSSSSFYMLVRSKLTYTHFVNGFTKVVLFHKTTLPRVSIEQAQIYKFDCLNAHMVNRGHVTDTNPDSCKSCNIFIEQYLVDLLFSQQQRKEQQQQQQQHQKPRSNCLRK